jgi:cytochrome c oxidase subunit 2
VVGGLVQLGSVMREGEWAPPLLLADAIKGLQDAWSPGGPMAARINSLWWLNFWVAAVVLSAVVLLVIAGAARSRRKSGQRMGAHEPTTRSEQRAGVVVGSAVAATAVILFVLLIADFAVGSSLHRADTDPDTLSIRVTGHQWWWDIWYQDGPPSQQFRTGNEIHIPVGRTVRLDLQSTDVIHSFWVPSLQGKKDLIPGHPTTISLRADQPGVYDGQCAEFCGMQHAKMRFQVIAQSQNDYDAWRAGQVAPAPDPRTQSEIRGRDVFLSGTCVMCHTVRGTTAGSGMGPDLTHVASRQWLAAASIPNTRGYLGGWILDPQHLKPGSRMPTQQVTPADLNALLDYLETLK